MPDDQEDGRESVEAENTRFHAPTFTNDLVHDYPKLDPAHDQVEEERNLFLEIPVVNQDRETVKEDTSFLIISMRDTSFLTLWIWLTKSPSTIATKR